jgi:hypothetical protein
MGGIQRTLVERKDLGHEFGRGKGMGKPHCAEVNEERAVIYRVYTPGPNSRDDYLLKVLRNDYDVALHSETLREWIHEGAFAFAVLVETRKRKEKLARLIEHYGPSEINIVIDIVPPLGNLAATIRDLAKKGGKTADVPATSIQGN